MTETEVTKITQDLAIEFEAFDELYAKVENSFSITFTNNDDEDIDKKLTLTYSSGEPSNGFQITQFMLSLKPGESVTRKFSHAPYRVGKEYLVVNDEIDNVIAFKEVTIVDYKEPRLTIISAKFNNVHKTMKHEEDMYKLLKIKHLSVNFHPS